MANNPLPATPNPLVNELVGQLRGSFWKGWHGQTVGAKLRCAGALDQCKESELAAVFTREWESWLEILKDQIKLYFDTFFDIGKANRDCALPDPGTWAFDALYRLIGENLTWVTSQDHIVDGWIKTACRRRPVSIREVPPWAGAYRADAAKEALRDDDQIFPVLRDCFEQASLLYLMELRTGAWLRLAKLGWQPTREDKPDVSLKDLEELAPRDRRRKKIIRTTYLMLQQDILGARNVARRGEVSIETIRQRFTLLADADDDWIKERILQSPDGTSEATAAKELIHKFAGNISGNTIDRYTRQVSDGPDVKVSNSTLSQRPIISLLPPELLPPS